MWALRTCGAWPFNEIKTNTHTKKITGLFQDAPGAEVAAVVEQEEFGPAQADGRVCLVVVGVFLAVCLLAVEELHVT